MKTIILTAIAFLLVSCGCDTPECITALYEGKVIEQQAIQKRYEIAEGYRMQREREKTPEERAAEIQARAIKSSSSDVTNTMIGIEVVKFLLK